MESVSPLWPSALAVCFVWALGVTAWYLVTSSEHATNLDKLTRDNKRLRDRVVDLLDQMRKSEEALSTQSRLRSLAESVRDMWWRVVEQLSDELDEKNEELIVLRDGGDALTAIVRDHVRRLLVEQLSEQSGVGLSVSPDGKLEVNA